MWSTQDRIPLFYDLANADTSPFTFCPFYLNIVPGGFPGGLEIKNPPANAGDMGSIPGAGRYQMARVN